MSTARSGTIAETSQTAGSAPPGTAPFIDTLSAAYDVDIHTAHREARARSWYATTPMGLIFLDYESVHWLLHEKRFRLQGNDALDLAGIRDGRLREWFGQILSNKEGEPHARLRRVVARAFTPRQVERLRPMMRATAAEFLDSLAGRSGCVSMKSRNCNTHPTPCRSRINRVSGTALWR